MIHLDRAGRVIDSFDAPQGHGMDVASDGFVYLGQDTVRKYDPLDHLLFERYGVRSGHVSSQPPHLWTSATRQLTWHWGPV